MNTAEVAIIARAVVDLALIGAGTKIALTALPRLSMSNPRVPGKRTAPAAEAGSEQAGSGS